MQEKVKNLTPKEEEQCVFLLWGYWMKTIIMVLGSGPTSADSAFHRQNLQEEVDILLICETSSKIMKIHCQNNICDNTKALHQLNKAMYIAIYIRWYTYNCNRNYIDISMDAHVYMHVHPY